MKLRKITVVGDVGYLPLTQGKVALIDAEDAEFVGQWNWCFKKNREKGLGYALRTKRNIYLHKELCPGDNSLQVDHIDCNPLNNRKTNLRRCNYKQNGYNKSIYLNNTSGYKGVSWLKKTEKWQAQLKHGGKAMYLGVYENKEDAARAYNEAAINYQGAFAYLNDVQDQVKNEEQNLVQIYQDIPRAA